MDDRRIDEMAERLDRLERENHRWRRAATLVVAGVFLAFVAGRGPARLFGGAREKPARDGEQVALRDRATQIARDRLEVSRRALEIIAASIKNGAGLDNAVDDIYDWSYRMLGDEIYLSMDTDEARVEDPEVFLVVSPAKHNRQRLAAFEAHYRRMRAWEDRLRPLADRGTLSRFDFLEIKAHRLQAELFLARERQKENP